MPAKLDSASGVEEDQLQPGCPSARRWPSLDHTWELATMSVALHLSTFALQTLVNGACKTIGIDLGDEAVEGVVKLLASRFTDHSQRLTRALHDANERAWQALEISLAGDSWWDRCK